MTITVEVAPDIELRLQEEAQRLGESLDAVASRVLAETLRAKQQFGKRFQVKPLNLDVPEKWKGLTPNEIDFEMELEAYQEKLERARHESAGVCI